VLVTDGNGHTHNHAQTAKRTDHAGHKGRPTLDASQVDAGPRFRRAVRCVTAGQAARTLALLE
jgi:hypothetical protein